MTAFPRHGTLAAYDLGCRSRGGCPNHGSDRFLTCAEAAMRFRSDFDLARLPEDQPLPRSAAEVQQILDELATPTRKHGTVWGYRQGCRHQRECPNWTRGLASCADARRAYFTKWRERRMTGVGTPVEHGTSRGYSTGCRTDAECPGNEEGVSCRSARRQYMTERARRSGVGPKIEAVDSAAAIELTRALLADGWSLRAIARGAGLGRETVRALSLPRPRMAISPATWSRLRTFAHDPRSTTNHSN